MNTTGQGSSFQQGSSLQNASTFRELFTPKFLTVLRKGYNGAQLRADAFAGLTVAIIALPLSMAIAIASGVSPDRGLYTAIIGGFLVSLLGGSRYQIGGPAGAFIILVAATVAAHGVSGLILATLMSGIFLAIIGFAQLGTYIKFIPYPVTVGFTAGIAVIIFASQMREFFGLTLKDKEPGELLPRLQALYHAGDTINYAATGLACLTVALIVVLKYWRPQWPGMLIALVIASLAAFGLHLPVETIGTRFGGIARALPAPALPLFTLSNMLAVLPAAVAFTLLGAIESLLSAVVADGMSGGRHRSNCELVAQGIANIGVACFGGICVTGTIARTATNIRAGAYSPVAGILHALFLLLFMLIAAPLASYVPLAALAGLLAVVAFNMIEKHAFVALIRSSRGDALVLLVTFFLVIFRNLTEAIVVGFVLGSIVFMDRMGKLLSLESHQPLVREDIADSCSGDPPASHMAGASSPDPVIYRMSGAFFFGAASAVSSVLDGIMDNRRNFILDCSAVPFLDSTAANVLESVARKARYADIRFTITGANKQARHMLTTNGVKEPYAHYADSIQSALAEIEDHTEKDGTYRDNAA